jgi:hypothetical protein
MGMGPQAQRAKRGVYDEAVRNASRVDEVPLQKK